MSSVLIRALLVIAVFLGVNSFLATEAYAGMPSQLVPCGNQVEYTVGDQYIVYTGECDVCDLSKLGMNILNFLIAICVAVAALLFVNAGFLYVSSSANPGNIARAHKMFTSTLIGLIAILAAYLLIDTVMKSLLNGGAGAIGTYGPWNEILCVGDTDAYMIRRLGSIDLNASQLVLPPPPVDSDPETPEAISGPLPTQILILPKCPPTQSGLCSIQNLYPWFGDNAGIASGICLKESGGLNRPSTCDACTNYNPEVPFSFGLFQINIRANTLPGLNCPSAFTNYVTSTTCSYTCTVDSSAGTLYDRCRTAALDTSVNTAKANYLSSGGTDWSCWSTAFATECDAPRLDTRCNAPGATSDGTTALVNL